jgi:F-box/leucine-rich repeat protein 2/20
MVHDESNPASVSMIDISQVAPLYAQPVFSVEKRTDAAILKAKGRSYSSPFPLASSPLDIISSPEPSVSSPVPVEARDFFDELLPRELKLQILSLFVSLYEADFHQLSAKGKWTVLRASSVKNKWVGRDKGVRELIKLGRVSHFHWTSKK